MWYIVKPRSYPNAAELWYGPYPTKQHVEIARMYCMGTGTCSAARECSAEQLPEFDGKKYVLFEIPPSDRVHSETHQEFEARVSV